MQKRINKKIKDGFFCETGNKNANYFMSRIFNFLVLFALLLMQSCSYYPQRKIMKQSSLEARNPKYECFIQFNDGTIKPFTNLVLKHPPLAYEYLEGDGKKIDEDVNNIRAFQTPKFYAERIYDERTGGIGKLPFTELFASRIRNGKIELFMIAEMKNNTYGPNSSGYEQSFFLRKGKEDKLRPFSAGLLKEMVKDKKDLYDNFNDYYIRNYAFKGAMQVLDEYN